MILTFQCPFEVFCKTFPVKQRAQTAIKLQNVYICDETLGE